MRKTLKMASVLMAGAVTAASLCGCTNEPVSSQNSAGTQADNSASSEDQITLRFMWWGGDERNEATLAVINQYQELHPNIRIEAEMNSDQG